MNKKFKFFLYSSIFTISAIYAPKGKNHNGIPSKIIHNFTDKKRKNFLPKVKQDNMQKPKKIFVSQPQKKAKIQKKDIMFNFQVMSVLSIVNSTLIETAKISSDLIETAKNTCINIKKDYDNCLQNFYEKHLEKKIDSTFSAISSKIDKELKNQGIISQDSNISDLDIKINLVNTVNNKMLLTYIFNKAPTMAMQVIPYLFKVDPIYMTMYKNINKDIKAINSYNDTIAQ